VSGIVTSQARDLKILSGRAISGIGGAGNRNYSIYPSVGTVGEEEKRLVNWAGEYWIQNRLVLLASH